MPRIGIDCRFASTASGLGRYTRELATALLKRRDAEYVLFVQSPSERWIPVGAETVTTPIPHYSVAEQTVLPGILAKAQIDLLFVPHFNVPFRCPVPVVVTIHDLILHRFPNHAGLLRRLAYRVVLRSALARARGVIAVSAFSAGELAAAYGPLTHGKVRVVHEAASPEFAPPPAAERARVLVAHGITKPYFLYVGNAKQHKNVQTLLDAYALLGDPSVELVLVTGGREAERLRAPPGARFLANLPDTDLPSLYAEARCFVSASLYEGFGLPLLESHACGCPAIVSDRASFSEIAPPGTVLAEPTATALAEAMRHPPIWKAAVTRRSWDDVAEETSRVLADALPMRKRA